jgi:hypothetical protein
MTNKNKRIISIDRLKVENIISGKDADYELIEKKSIQYLRDEIIIFTIKDRNKEQYFSAKEMIFSSPSKPSSWNGSKEILFSEVFKRVVIYYE